MSPCIIISFSFSMSTPLFEFHWADYVVCCLSFGISIAIGIYFACTGGKQRTTKEFLMADRKGNSYLGVMNVWFDSKFDYFRLRMSYRLLFFINKNTISLSSVVSMRTSLSLSIYIYIYIYIWHVHLINMTIRYGGVDYKNNIAVKIEIMAIMGFSQCFIWIPCHVT